MFGQISERRMHVVRWVLTGGWLLLIASLLYDPLSPWLTDPENTLSPLRIDSSLCVKVQGVCLKEQPYAQGTTIFWGVVVPSSIFILLIFGHELWRRICPLSFLSQVPRALGWQRQIKRENSKAGKARYELVKVKPGSWLGRNYRYLQFGLLYLGLCARILFINSDCLALAAWFGLTIAAAIAVGYLYGGKSWCQYFCPMAPVQVIYAEPSGLLASKAHISDQQITQSMCRTVDEDGKEQSACVACQNPCIDIDAERSYWDSVAQPAQKVELLLLMEGSAQIQSLQPGEDVAISTQSLLPGQVLDELEVLSRARQASTIVAKAEPTRILAIPVDAFDDLLACDRDFARRVLEMESRRLQQILPL
jgi:4Fe-4S binding domain